jgi:hypothetical protein
VQETSALRADVFDTNTSLNLQHNAVGGPFKVSVQPQMWQLSLISLLNSQTQNIIIDSDDPMV